MESKFFPLRVYTFLEGRQNNTHGRFLAIFDIGEHFSDFLFMFLYIWKRFYPKKKDSFAIHIAPTGSEFFPLI